MRLSISFVVVILVAAYVGYKFGGKIFGMVGL